MSKSKRIALDHDPAAVVAAITAEKKLSSELKAAVDALSKAQGTHGSLRDAHAKLYEIRQALNHIGYGLRSMAYGVAEQGLNDTPWKQAAEAAFDAASKIHPVIKDRDAFFYGEGRLAASDRKNLIRLASTMEKGSEERKAILAGLAKSASHTGKILIEVDVDRQRKSDTFPKGQPYVEFDGKHRYYLVSPPGSPRGGKLGEWRDRSGMMPLESLLEIAALIYEGDLA